MSRKKFFKTFILTKTEYYNYLSMSSFQVVSKSPKPFVLPLGNCAKITPIRLCSTKMLSPVNPDNEVSALDPVEEIDLSDYCSQMSPRFNFAMYADKSPLIQKLIDLGVNLYEIEKRPKGGEFLLTLTVEKMQPYLFFLTDAGVSADKLGSIITKNPFLFKEDLENLQVRVNYLLSKKFSKEMISNIIEKNSKWLCTPVKVIDERLGYLQKTYKLSGDSIRKMVTKTPAIALIDKKIIITNTYALKEELGLDVHSFKRIIVEEPCLLKISSYDLVATFDYLTRVMKVSLDLIVKQPKVLTCRKFILKERHKFLESLGRAQYCHLLPGYITLNDLVSTSDSEFCKKIAKASENLFYDFIKTL